MSTSTHDTTLYDLYPLAAFELADSLGITRSLTVAERDAIDDSDFAWPDAPGGKPKYPIDTQEHLDAAATLIGRAPKDAQDKIKSRAMRIAKKNGLKLPDTWTEDESKDDSDRTLTPVIVRADGTHDPFTGAHTHTHTANNSQGNDDTHDHSHNHDNDADHKHTHADRAGTPDIMRSMPSETQLYLPILRYDREKREVIVRATAEVLDGYGTVFDFNGSKEAFGKWRGNIREMHDPHKAVGRAIKIDPVPEDKAIDVILRVSRGAEDTWQKVLDGTLSGASVGAKNGKWGKRTINGQEVPVLERYDMVELSLVDNPATPGCDVKIVRSDGADGQFLASDILDFAEDETPPVARAETPTETRAGATISAATGAKMHTAMHHALQTAKTLADAHASQGCADCQAVSTALDPDQDGDIDIVPDLDTDHDGGSASGDGSGDGEARALRTLVTRIVQEVLTEQLKQNLQPVTARMNGIAARFAGLTFDTSITHDSPEITRRLDGVEQKLSELGEVRALVSAVKGTVEQIAAQPQQGGPVVNSAIMRQQMATQQQQSQSQEPEVSSVWRLAQVAKERGLTREEAVSAGMDIYHGLVR